MLDRDCSRQPQHYSPEGTKCYASQDHAWTAQHTWELHIHADSLLRCCRCCCCWCWCVRRSRWQHCPAAVGSCSIIGANLISRCQGDCGLFRLCGICGQKSASQGSLSSRRLCVCCCRFCAVSSWQGLVLRLNCGGCAVCCCARA